MRAADLPEIRGLPLFESMAASSFDTMMLAAYFQIFPPQVELIREGDPADFLYIVVDGCVELFARSNNREATFGMVLANGTFILAAVLKDAAYLMSARTSTRSRVLMIPAESVRQAFEEDAAFARAIVVEQANGYRSVIKELKALKLRTAVERLANRLLRLHAEQGGTGDLTLPHDKRTLAALLAMTPENLSRAFNTLKPYGVEVDGPRVRLTDLRSLAVLAKPNPLIDDQAT
ncbi:MAG: cyclic nucleotide-binding domain-containing protein [Lautropia sp.]